MNCLPDPAATCGETLNDTCVNITGTWPACFPTTAGPCYRQSDFNSAAGSLICQIITTIGGSPALTLPAGVPSIISSIDLSGLTSPCDPTIAVIGTTVVAEFQNVYNILCGMRVDLNLPVDGLDMECLEDPCGDPISTLGQLLEIIITRLCDQSPLIYEATLTQLGLIAPVPTVLQNTLGPISEFTWTYGSPGSYDLVASGTSLGIFANDNTTVLIGTGNTLGQEVKAYRVNADIIRVITGLAGVATDAILAQTTIQIKVYP